jgi:hypothetical protein
MSYKKISFEKEKKIWLWGRLSKKIFKNLWLLVFLTSSFFVLSVATTNAAGPTYVTEDIDSPTTWTLENSPYVINCDVYININDVLTIEPGVVVKSGMYLNSGGIYVHGDQGGQLLAIGTENEPIIFTSVIDNTVGGVIYDGEIPYSPFPGAWKGFLFENNTQSELRNVEIRYAGDFSSWAVVRMVNSSGVKIDNLIIKESTEVVIRIQDSEIEINNININEGDYSVAIWFEGEGTFTLENSAILNCMIYGILIDNDSSFTAMPVIKNNLISGNVYSGLNYENETGPTLDATGNDWGHESGPQHPDNQEGQGDQISGNVIFDPWIGKSSGLDPVILIPGITGSKLSINGEIINVWPSVLRMLASPSDDYLDDLKLDLVGNSEQDIFPVDVIREISTSDIFEGLIIELENNGYEEGENLFVFPYDWRLSIDDVVDDENGKVGDDNLQYKIETVKNITGSDKVDLVVHSMGGLVAKRYMQKHGTDSIDQFVDISTPHLGSVDIFEVLSYGDNRDIFFLNKEKVKEISQNFPSAYQLLPSREYFNQDDNMYSAYISDIYDFDENGTKGNLDYDQSLEFMRNTGRNPLLLPINDELHQGIDFYYPDQYGVETHNIIGVGEPTVGRVYVLNKKIDGETEYTIRYLNGDGSVPLKSSEALRAPHNFYTNGLKHGGLSSEDGVKQLVRSILKGEDFDFTSYDFINPDENIYSFSGKQVSFHSPLSMHIYDNEGHHTGPNENGDLENNIPGVKYDTIEGNKFVFLPDGLEYRIVGQAEHEGHFNVRIQDIVDGEYLGGSYFNEIPLSSEETNIEIESSSPLDIKIDQDGDSIFEEVITPSSSFSEGDFEKPITQIFIAGELYEDYYFDKVEISLEASDNVAVLKTEYSLDDGQTWNIYSQPFEVAGAGEYQLSFMSTDSSGNVEITKQESFVIKEKPTIERVIKKIKDFYEDGQIKKQVKNFLIAQLSIIQKKIADFAKQKDKISTKEMKLCQKRKDESFCEHLKDEINEKAVVAHQKLIKTRYDLILKQLDFYLKKGWLSAEAFDIFYYDINFLKNNI